MTDQNMGFSTKAIHANRANNDPYLSLNTPIYASSTFAFESCKQGGDRFAGEQSGYIYSRLGNPTTTELENRVAALEGAEACASFSSGMGAIASVVWTALRAGDHIIADEVLYGCTYAYFEHGISRYGVEVTFCDLSDTANLERALRPNTRLIYTESPINPNLKILDLKQLADIAHRHNPDIVVVCDNTFATPYLQLPLELGCDVVVHSATKYLNGHGDVIAGLACGKADFIKEVKLFGLKDMTGSVLGPFEAFLILRGLKTIELRMERHCDNAEAITNYLLNNDKVSRVYYPGLESHPNHDVAKRQMKRYGGMVSFELSGGREAGARLLDNVKLCTLAVSLGDAETLVEHPASMTHSTYSLDELEKAGVSAGLVRLSTGLENVEDIIADLDQAFKKV